MKFNNLIENNPNIFDDPEHIRGRYSGWKEVGKIGSTAHEQIMAVYYLEYAYSEKLEKAYLWIKCTYNSHQLGFWGLQNGQQTILQGSIDKIISYLSTSINEIVTERSSKSVWNKDNISDVLLMLKGQIKMNDDKNGALATPDNNGERFAKNPNWDAKLTISMTDSKVLYKMNLQNIKSDEKEMVDRRFKRSSTEVKTLTLGDDEHDKKGTYIVTGKKPTFDNLDDFIGSLNIVKRSPIKPTTGKASNYWHKERDKLQ